MAYFGAIVAVGAITYPCQAFHGRGQSRDWPPPVCAAHLANPVNGFLFLQCDQPKPVRAQYGTLFQAVTNQLGILALAETFPLLTPHRHGAVTVTEDEPISEPSLLKDCLGAVDLIPIRGTLLGL